MRTEKGEKQGNYSNILHHVSYALVYLRVPCFQCKATSISWGLSNHLRFAAYGPFGPLASSSSISFSPLGSLLNAGTWRWVSCPRRRETPTEQILDAQHILNLVISLFLKYIWRPFFTSIDNLNDPGSEGQCSFPAYVLLLSRRIPYHASSSCFAMRCFMSAGQRSS